MKFNFLSESRKQAIKKESSNLSFLVVVLLGLAWMLIYGMADKTLAFQSVTFEPSLPANEYLIPWKVDRLTFKGSAYQNEVVNYANAIGGKDFTLTIVTENGTLDPMRRSNVIGSNGHWDFGICQLNTQWHEKFVRSDDFKDWRKQAHYCLGVYKRRQTAFYAYKRRKMALKSFL